MASPYIYDATALLHQSLQDLDYVLKLDGSNHENSGKSTLHNLRRALTVTEGVLYQYVDTLLREKALNGNSMVFPSQRSLSCSVGLLRSMELEEKQPSRDHKRRDGPQVYYPKRSATGSLLFRLVVALQLCVVRIDDARYVLGGSRKKETPAVHQDDDSSYLRWLRLSALTGAACAAVYIVKRLPNNGMNKGGRRADNDNTVFPLLLSTAQVGVAIVAARFLKRSWGNLWMTTKIVRTIEEIEEWNNQWDMVQSTPGNARAPGDDNALDAAKSKRLIEYALRETPKVRIFFVFLCWNVLA